jgi:energy-coupling factor transporter ATP-binding protein EcfA2
MGATEFVTHMARISGLPRTAARERTAEVLRHVGLYEERYRQIGGYSTGMKQRVKLAQALVHDPKLLLLDEPTNGLDPAGRDEMLDLIKRTGTEFGIAVVVASHLLGEIEQVCTYLLAIDAGHLLRAAPISTFTARTPVLAVEVEEGADRLAAALAGRALGRSSKGTGFSWQSKATLSTTPSATPWPIWPSRWCGSSRSAVASRTCSAMPPRRRGVPNDRSRIPRRPQRRPAASTTSATAITRASETVACMPCGRSSRRASAASGASAGPCPPRRPRSSLPAYTRCRR